MLAVRIACVVLSAVIFSNAEECKQSITTASGSSAPKQICSGELIFDENFDSLDKQKWKPLVTFWDGGVSKKLFSSEVSNVKVISLYDP